MQCTLNEIGRLEKVRIQENAGTQSYHHGRGNFPWLIVAVCICCRTQTQPTGRGLIVSLKLASINSTLEYKDVFLAQEHYIEK